jgi:hypothetical protein
MSVRSVLLAFALLVLTGCPVKNNALLLEDTLSAYAAAIRWGHMADALGFVDPETLKKHPVTALDLARYQQVQISVYSDGGPVHINDNEVSQIVEIGLVTSIRRCTLDRRRAVRYDAKERCGRVGPAHYALIAAPGRSRRNRFTRAMFRTRLTRAGRTNS